MTPFSLEYLLNRYADRTITPVEKDELMKLLAMPENEAEFHRLIDRMLEERAPRHELSEETAAAILKAIFQSEEAEAPRPVVRPIWPRWVAAACILLLAGLGYLYWPGPPPPAVHLASHIPRQKDVTPGADKAILTLADGTRIDLDSAGNGNLATRGEAVVRKTGGGQLTYNSPSLENEPVFYNTLSTPRGGQYRIVLADGSRVWLNAASSITYPTAFRGKERRVEVTGEAYFEVAKNPAAPFVVKTAGMEVQVLGTHFNVMGYEDEREKKITLLEGSVKVTTDGDARTAYLRPGQQANLARNGSLTVHSGVNLDEAVAWKNGLFDFDSTDIDEVMLQLARWYDVQIQYPAKVPDTHYTGSIVRSVNLSEVLKMLELAGDVRFSIDGKRILVKGD